MSLSSGPSRISAKASIPGLIYSMSPESSNLNMLPAAKSGSMPSPSMVFRTSFSASLMPLKISSSTNSGQDVRETTGGSLSFSSSSFAILPQMSSMSSIQKFVFPLQNPRQRAKSLSQLSEPNVEGLKD